MRRQSRLLEARVAERTEELVQANTLLKREVAERERAERQLRLIVDSSPAYIAYVTADDLHYQFVNHRFEAAFGLPRKEIVGKHIKDIVGQADYEFALPYIEKVRSGQPASYENVFPLQQGARRMQVNYVPDFDEQGVVKGIVVLSHDITERKLAGEAVQELALDLGERVKELNCLYGISNLVETPGISLDEILQGTADLIPPAWQYAEITCARITLKGQEFSTKNYLESPWQQAADILVHGERCGRVQVGYLQERPLSDSASGSEGPFQKEERNLINAIAELLGGIAERMRAEQHVRQQHQFLQNVLDSLSHPFYVINARNWTVELANRAAYAGMLPGDITCHALMHGRDQPCEPKNPCPLEEIKSTKVPVVLEHVHVGEDGERRDVEVRGFPILDGEDNVVQMIEYTLDITERKRAEARLRQSEARLAALEERERIGRELHDDLAQMIGYVDVQAQAALTRLEQGQEAHARAILAQLARAAQDANADLRQHILGIRTSRMAGADQPAAQGAGDFLAILSQYLDTLRERYGLETQVSWPDGRADSPLAPEIETRLLGIIQEALTNVARHAGACTARLLFTFHPGEVQVIVEDDGCGFVTGSVETGEGAGHFGLAMIRERAEAVGGSLEIRSAPGEGTRIIVRLPCALAPSSLEGKEPVAGIRVLLVDDHPLYLEGLRTLLSARGMQVVGMAHDGLEAQEQARALRPDLILMDVQMPRCDGLEATRRIKAELPEVKIVMLTMAADGEALFGALKSGASGYLLKSLDGAKFFALLADVMRGETVLSPALANLLLSEFAPEPGDDTEDTATLTARQREVLELVAQGQTNKEIARALHVSEATVKYHVSQILERLHLQSRYQMAEYSQERGLASPLDG